MSQREQTGLEKLDHTVEQHVRGLLTGMNRYYNLSDYDTEEAAVLREALDQGFGAATEWFAHDDYIEVATDLFRMRDYAERKVRRRQREQTLLGRKPWQAD